MKEKECAYGVDLFPPQREVVDSGVLFEQKHCILNMATGSGKTFLAELAIEHTLEEGYRVICITPLKALAEQQKKSWQARFPAFPVQAFTGDTPGKLASGKSYADTRLYVMTPERFDACMRYWRQHWCWIPDVNLIVVDEFHLIGQRDRGPRLEGALTRLLRLNPFVRVLGLSATAPNAKELASWMCGVSFSSDWRQIPLRKMIKRFKNAKEKPALALEAVKQCVESGGQSLVFCNSRSRAQQTAEFLNTNGISSGFHHAGLDYADRQNVEHSFATRQIQALVATSTLEMGINLPARQVVIYDSYVLAEYGFASLPVWSFIQRAGRAGRPGMDTEGEVVLLLPQWAKGAHEYLNERCENVESQLSYEKAMTEQLLIEICTGLSKTREELQNGFLPLTLYQKQHREAQINSLVNRLVKYGLIEEKDDNVNLERRSLKTTVLGTLSVKLMTSPETVKLIECAYRSFERLYLFDLLLICALSPDCSPILRTDYEELDALWSIVSTRPSKLLDLNAEQFKSKLGTSMEKSRLLSAVKMSAVCHLLTEGINAKEITKVLHTYPSDVSMLQENIVRLLSGVSAICSTLEKTTKKEEGSGTCYKLKETSSMLSDMLQNEIGSELVAITEIKGVGGLTAKKLAQKGYQSLKQLSSASVKELSVIDGIGDKFAASIITQAAQLDGTGKTLSYSEPQIETVVRKRQTFPFDPYRLVRSLELRIRGQDGEIYYITGGRDDHVVRWNDGNWRCDCPDFAANGGLCKHILCVKRSHGDKEIIDMLNEVKNSVSGSIRHSLPFLWYQHTEEWKIK